MFKLAIFQPLVPKYRTPLFDAIALRDDIELTVFAGKNQGSLKADDGVKDYKLVDLPVQNFNVLGAELKWQRGVIKKISDRKYDVVVLSWDIRYLNLPLLIVYTKLKNIKVVLWGHGYSKSSRKLNNIVRNFYGKIADGIILYSKTVANKMVQLHGFDEGKVFVAQNAIDISQTKSAINYWSSRSQDLISFQKDRKIYKQPVIIFVSRLEPDNELNILIDGIIELSKYHKGGKLVIIGDGADRHRLEEYVKEKRIGNSVIFAGAIYDEVELARWMLSATLFCYPRNIGLSILHAFAYGLPVVTGDDVASHNPEIEALIPDVNGLLFEDRNVDDMVRSWLSIIDNKALHECMNKAAFKQVDSIYTIENMVHGFVGLKQLVSDKS